MRNPEDVVAQLNSWKNVADELYKRGVKGVRDNCEACPIATYLCRETGMNIEVDIFAATFRDPDDPVDGVEFILAPTVSKFISRFDDGEYPDLDENPYVEDDECV